MTDDPNVPAGPGLPDGSVHGSETDPSRAGTGAKAKIKSFVQRNLHLLNTANAERLRFELQITMSDDGGSIARGHVRSGSGDTNVDADLARQLVELAENHTPVPDMSEAEKAEVAGAVFIVVYTP